jgi:hypothetical protein
MTVEEARELVAGAVAEDADVAGAPAVRARMAEVDEWLTRIEQT